MQNTVPFLGIELREIEQRSGFGDTPLILVMTWDDLAAAKLLLEAGADVSAKGEHGDTALHRAVCSDSADLVALLLANRASPAVKNDRGETPLDLAKLLGKTAWVRMLTTSN